MSSYGNSTVTKLLHVTEEAAPAVHVPVMVGNELFMLTQQDVRRVEDTRHICYNRWIPSQHAEKTAQQLAPPDAMQQLASLCQQNVRPSQDVGLQTEEPQTKSVVAKQVKWTQSCKSSSPCPITYSVGTSTNGLKSESSTIRENQATKHCSCLTAAATVSTACNTNSVHSLDHVPMQEQSRELRRSTLILPHCVIKGIHDEE